MLPIAGSHSLIITESGYYLRFLRSSKPLLGESSILQRSSHILLRILPVPPHRHRYTDTNCGPVIRAFCQNIGAGKSQPRSEDLLPYFSIDLFYGLPEDGRSLDEDTMNTGQKFVQVRGKSELECILVAKIRLSLSLDVPD
jgi:hypothetical protein